MPAYGEDLAVYGAMFVIGVAAGATGIGGGGLNVPMLMLWSRFDIKEAVPLSHSAVMGNALAMLLINAPQRHPACPQRPLIHYELALLLLPAMLGGSSAGVIVGRACPPALLIVLSLCLLVFATAKTVKKGIHIAHARTAENLLEAKDTQPELALDDAISIWSGRGVLTTTKETTDTQPELAVQDTISIWNGRGALTTTREAKDTQEAKDTKEAMAAADTGTVRNPCIVIAIMI